MQKSVHDSNLYYFKDKGSIEITSKLEALGRALSYAFRMLVNAHFEKWPLQFLKTIYIS